MTDNIIKAMLHIYNNKGICDEIPKTLLDPKFSRNVFTEEILTDWCSTHCPIFDTECFRETCKIKAKEFLYVHKEEVAEFLL